ncbi:MAG: hypothetical protein GY940_20910, partial [bacterium]|nr:hypothetical protein [bacterium]
MEDPDDDSPGHIPHGQDIKFDLEPYVTEYQNGIRIHWAYAKELFDPATIEYMASQYRELVDFFGTNPGKSYGDYRVDKSEHTFTPVERESTINTDHQFYPFDEPTLNPAYGFSNDWEKSSIVGMFEEQVDKTPGETAIHNGQTKLSYEELNRYANRIAHMINRHWPGNNNNETL